MLNEPRRPKLTKSPLVLALAQVRFSPVLKMKEYVPDIQEALRKDGFSWYQEEQIQQILIGPEFKTERGYRWAFATRDRRDGVLLTNDFVVFETNRYGVFEEFQSGLRKVLQLIKDKVAIDFAAQVGLRYVNLIRPTDTRSARTFLCEDIRGLSGEGLEAKDIRHLSITEAQTPCGRLLIRSAGSNDGSILPPDLVPVELEFHIELRPNESVHILDIDHISTVQRDFDPSVLTGIVEELHGHTRRAFEASVTREAIEFWK